MTDDDSPDRSDLEWRLHAMLEARGQQVDPHLSGPDLRARADHAPGRLRRAAPIVAVAATVAAIAVGVAVGTAHDAHPNPRPVQPGGVSTPRSSTVPTPTQTPTSRPRTSAAPRSHPVSTATGPTVRPPTSSTPRVHTTPRSSSPTSTPSGSTTSGRPHASIPATSARTSPS